TIIPLTRRCGLVGKQRAILDEAFVNALADDLPGSARPRCALDRVTGSAHGTLPRNRRRIRDRQQSRRRGNGNRWWRQAADAKSVSTNRFHEIGFVIRRADGRARPVESLVLVAARWFTMPVESAVPVAEAQAPQPTARRTAVRDRLHGCFHL